MTVRIKEVLIKYEDDGEESPLNAEELVQKYRPLNLVIHHHCAPPSKQTGAKTEYVEDEAIRYEIDLNEINSK